jgi:hypothetical protein
MAVAMLWALFIYASVFSDWLEPAGGKLFAEAHASSYLDASAANRPFAIADQTSGAGNHR